MLRNTIKLVPEITLRESHFLVTNVLNAAVVIVVLTV